MSTDTKYGAIVIDPPWQQKAGPSFHGVEYDSAAGRTVARRGHGPSRDLPYPTMSLSDLRWMTPEPRSLALPDAHLFVWVTNRYLQHVHQLVGWWGFKPVTLLTWAKAPMGSGLGGPAFAQTTEHVLYATLGSPEVRDRQRSTWWNWRRPYNATGKPDHSRKPEGFLDMVEQTCPGPYLEIFARRQRLGWDVLGNETADPTLLVAAAPSPSAGDRDGR